MNKGVTSMIVRKLFPHISFILSLLMITFFILDIFNPGMNFVGNDIFKILLALYGTVTLILSGFLIVSNINKKKDKH